MPSVIVLVLSSSTVNFQEADGSPSLLSTLQDALLAGRPEAQWRCSGELLFATASMSNRSVQLAQRHQPDIVILRPTGLSFLHDDVASQVKLRWPRLYSTCLLASRLFDRLSGGRAREGSYRRRLLFNGPRRLAARLIGEAPPLPVEDAARYVGETIDALLAQEAFDLLCRIGVGTVDSNVPLKELQRRVDYFASRIRAQCMERRVPFADNRDLFREAGLPLDYAGDRTHPGLRRRVLEGRAIAAVILKESEARPDAAPAHL
jgi:hypothetical protein